MSLLFAVTGSSTIGCSSRELYGTLPETRHQRLVSRLSLSPAPRPSARCLGRQECLGNLQPQHSKESRDSQSLFQNQFSCMNWTSVCVCGAGHPKQTYRSPCQVHHIFPQRQVHVIFRLHFAFAAHFLGVFVWQKHCRGEGSPHFLLPSSLPRQWGILVLLQAPSSACY